MRSQKTFHDQFDGFIESFGGRLVRALIGTDSPTFDNADYLFDLAGVIAELKVIETDRLGSLAAQDKVQAKFDGWWQSGRVAGFGLGRPVIQSDTLPADLQWELQRIHSEPVRILIKKANKQIRCTKECLKLPAAKGLLLLVNEADYSQPPEYLTYAVHQSLINDFSNINNGG